MPVRTAQQCRLLRGRGRGLLAATFVTIVFFCLDAAGLPQRLAIVRSEHAPTHRALLDFSLSVRTYWIVTNAVRG
ncbi:hypothetical protein M4D54_02115 [Brachybacterium sp. p3-SID1565]|uniref:Uncharacterized protein n=1 Tax=Brachybacterium epidermidis TaxID=2781983 RepID=A0ABR9W1B5_9MICO|nr:MULTISPECIES: hypothetical protein [Brachybacterium]MBE9404246.1 hypothetical protein [Brachybacterium epidermidis]MCT1384433.1 hypothetical protein [Brachybacterium sp. p3-SID1565]